METKMTSNKEDIDGKCLDTLLDHSPSAQDGGLFDDLIARVGNEGYFQKRLALVYNFCLVAVIAMPYLNIILALSVPEHHCFVPGRNNTQLTENQWMDKMLPKEETPGRRNAVPSSCKMYKLDARGEPTNETQGCEWGWEYDHTWYQLTAPSMNHWVCDRQIYVANSLIATSIGETIGCLIFGQLADRIGRKPVYFISVTTSILGRVGAVFSSEYFVLFLIMNGVGSLGGSNIVQATLVIGTEITGQRIRARIATLQFVGYLTGTCAVPLLAWWLGDWRKLLLATTLPCILTFVFYRWIPESPRWLATAGRVERAMNVLGYIARVNGRELPDDTLTVLQKMAKKKEPTYGIPSLFTNKRLAKNSIMLIACWGISGLLQYIILLNAPNLAGNPFMNVFMQTVSSVPGILLAQFAVNRVGRRWSTTGTYISVAGLTCIIILVHGIAGSPLVITTLVLLSQCLMTVGNYSLTLQGMEIFPTCVRQTGTSSGGIIVNIFSIFAPYIVYLGTSLDSRYPFFFIALLALLGAVCSSVLPETLNYRLPETLQDSANFGANQKFWSLNAHIT